MRWGVGAGASRLVSGTMTIHRRLEERLAEFKGAEAALLFGSGYLANIGVVSALARQGRGRLLRRAQPRVDHRRLPALARRDVRLPPQRHRAPRVGAARAGDRGALIVTDSVFSMDGDVAPLAELVGARAAPRRAARRSTRRTASAASAPAGAARSPRPASSARSTSSSARSARRSAPTARTSTCDEDLAQFLVNTARPFIFSTAPPPPAVAGALAALDAPRRERPRCVDAPAANGDDAARRAGPRGLRRLRLDDADRPARRRRRRRWRCGSASWRSSAASSPRRSARRRSRRAPRACAWR